MGAGPRLGVVGETPLGGNWSFDWLAGAAALFGQRTINLSATISENPSAITISQSNSDNATVFNVDAQVGLSYWFNPNLKMTASYRFDGYFNAIRTVNASGNLADVNRYYQGPMLRLTSKF
ncbi:MAG TPA: Lpg1974 family pore-forming outer membrane protein [Xanthobacteraceae bacterium]|nr:Lpg1974 family pore-forming outer membrane protein [Xanthobacteraceae bacterium]